MVDWLEWHRDYDDPDSLLSRRGELVRGYLRTELERAPEGDIRLISLCAGQFREEAFDTSHDGFMSVGAHRLTGEPAGLVPGRRLFTFVARGDQGSTV